jgi:4-amino-4-deoxy-L-arabinose transferase-like glycosyltransferase
MGTVDYSDLMPQPSAVTRRPSWRQRFGTWWPELLIMAGSLVLLAWGLSKNGYSNPYYAAAERSMTLSWRNFVFGSADPGGWITTDKPPLSLWLGALSARVFGFTSWSLLMPSVLAGVASVGLLMGAVRRAWGQWAGRVAGVVFALTPVVVAVSRANNPDATLVLFLVAAAYATQRAVSDRSPSWFVLAGFCCGLAFLAKLLVAGLVMPAIFAAYLISGPIGVWRRLRDLILAGAVFLLVAGAWIAVVDLTPASSRPYIGTSTNNTAQSVVFGFNGFGRLTGDQTFGVPGSGQGVGGFNLSGVLSTQPGLGGSPGIGRLFNAGMGDQVMWLVVIAGVALLGGLVLAVRRRLLRPQVGSLVLWGGFGLVTYIVFAYTQGIFHDYYVCVLAPSIAALVGIGVALARLGGRFATACVTIALAGTALLEVTLLRRVSAYPTLRVLVPSGLLVALAVFVVALRVRFFQRHLGAILIVGLAVALVAPALWALSGVRHTEDAAYASAGPPLNGTPRGESGNSVGFDGTAVLAPAELTWLRGQDGSERWIVAVPSDIEAEGPIVAGNSVMPMGGFYGTDPAMTQDRLAALVADNQLRFVDTGGFSLGDPNQINAVVAQACTHVDPALWGGAAPGTLYDCAGRQGAIRTTKVSAAPVGGPAFSGGGGRAGGIQLGPPAALQRLLSCFRTHGWNPTVGPLNTSTPTAQQAISACKSLIPAAVPGGAERRA